jgi:hypothetical protein
MIPEPRPRRDADGDCIVGGLGHPIPACIAGTTERILPHAVAQRFETSSSGALIPATEGSTKPVSVIVTAAGLATVEQYDLPMP